eukprot:997271-Rhodomonas_salina.1
MGAYSHTHGSRPGTQMVLAQGHFTAGCQCDRARHPCHGHGRRVVRVRLAGPRCQRPSRA